MKVIIDPDEWYPVYSIRDSYGVEVEVDPEVVARWQAAEAAFSAVQEEMGSLYEVAAQVERERREKVKAEKEAVQKAERDRVVAERRAEVAERQAKQEAVWQQIRANGGYIYDADGNLVGTIDGTPGNVRFTP